MDWGLDSGEYSNGVGGLNSDKRTSERGDM